MNKSNKKGIIYLLMAAVVAALTSCGGGGGGGVSSSTTPNPAGNLIAIAVTPSMPSIKVGTTQQFKATGTFFNSSTGITSTADVTGSVSWSSSATNVATISAGGLATGSGNGVSTITAASGLINGTATLSVVTWTGRTFGQGIPQALVWNGTNYVGAGGFYNSTDSRNWASTNANAAANDLAWDGSLYVAVGTAWFYVSTDGVGWSISAIPASVSSQSFYAVTKSSTTWVAVGGGGSIVYSTDGKTWTAAPTLTINIPTITNYAPALHAVAWTGTQFVAGGDSGALATSPDGKTWTVRAWANSTDTISAFGVNNGLIVATTSQPGLWTASDGTTLTWTQRLNPMPFWASHVKFAGGKWIAVGYSNLTATSPDGLTWTAGPVLPIASMSSVVYNGTEYIATGVDRNAVGAVYASTDGLNWTFREVVNKLTAAAINPTTGLITAVGTDDTSRASTDSATWSFGPLAVNDFFMDVTWSPQANGFVALIQSGANNYASTSTDGKTWNPASYSAAAAAPCGGLGSTVAAAPTVLVTAGSSLVGPCIATSTNNGSTWTAGTSPVPAGQSTTKAFWTGSQFVLLGSNGFIGTSPNGTTWTTQTSGTTVTLRGGVASPTKLVVVGDSGTILISTNGGTTWTAQTSGTTFTLNRVVWTGTQFYVVGGAATLLSSPDGITWTAINTSYSNWLTTFPYPTPPDFNDAVWSPTTNLLTIFGNMGLIATVP